jgi:NADH:ubiquinone oxidoreductase subunit
MQHRTYNGVSATDLDDVSWQKSHRSNSQGNCVELAQLPDGSVAVRNSRHPAGPALVYTKAEIQALILGAKAGDFDSLIA